MNPTEIYDRIKKETEVPCVNLKLTETRPSISGSKIGGLGYIPHEGDFPKDKNGDQLRLLAQIDCSQVGLAPFPEKGLLQFWIYNDDLSGMDLNNSTLQNRFRVIYYESVDETVTEEEVSSKKVPNKNEKDGGEDLMPVSGEYGLEFSKSTSFMTEHDCRFEKYDLGTDEPYDEIEGYEEDLNLAFGHKIGGYPGFSQWDPRAENDEHDFLLLQLDSEFGGGQDRIIWGDAGICNFFINSEKLKALDFSDVIYNWDCY